MKPDGETLYLDNAATSFPKPPEVVWAIADFLQKVGANPGRSAHRLAAEAARRVFAVREKVAALFAVSDSRRVIFTLNATQALNLALSGMLAPADHVVVSAMEHNAVMRPLRHLREQRRIAITVVAADSTGLIDPKAVAAAVRPTTRLVVCNHASNVTGALQDLDALRAHIGDCPLLVDGAQTAGAVPIDLEKSGVDLFAFSGHKSLLGPPGTGGLCLSARVEPEPLFRGGTGSGSASDRQPTQLPDYYESGTLNSAGLCGLGAALDWIGERGGVEAVQRHESALCTQLRDGLGALAGVTVYGPQAPARRVAVVSFNIAGCAPDTVGWMLDQHYAIACRVGLHCAPAAHRTVGTFADGTVRLAPGPFSTPADMERAIAAVAAIAAQKAA